MLLIFTHTVRNLIHLDTFVITHLKQKHLHGILKILILISATLLVLLAKIKEKIKLLDALLMDLELKIQLLFKLHFLENLNMDYIEDIIQNNSEI